VQNRPPGGAFFLKKKKNPTAPLPRGWKNEKGEIGGRGSGLLCFLSSLPRRKRKGGGPQTGEKRGGVRSFLGAQLVVSTPKRNDD